MSNEISKENVINLLNSTREEVRSWLDTFDAVLTDCDGVLWHDDIVIPGSAEVINKFISSGKLVYFVTNNGTKTRYQIWERAKSMGFNIKEENIISPTHTIAEYLSNLNFQQTAYVIGSKAITDELDAKGIKHFGVGPDVISGRLIDYIQRELIDNKILDVGAVIVGWDEHFSYGKMMKASTYLGTNNDCLFLTTNIDPVKRFPMYHIPDTGSIVSSIESCVDRTAIQMGKPNPLICEGLVNAGVLKTERTLMIGDCCKIDVTFGRNCGFQTLLVGTGSYQLEKLHNIYPNIEDYRKYVPDTYLPALGDLLTFL